jgi:hypothetical protein
MFKAYLLTITVALMVAPICLERANASPLIPNGFSSVAPTSDAEPVYYRGGVVVRGGGYRIGGPYYGGVWYGTGRRWYGGRWWPYGVGSCWSPSPIGYVWVCR